MQETKTPKIRVLVRKRPMNKKQIARGETDIIIVEKDQTVVVKQQKLKVDLTPYIEEYKYNFDGAYDEFTTNQQIYETSVRPLVDCAFDGAKVTCFAYGQTGSGKTHTMLGNGSNVRGLYILAAIDIFEMLQAHPEFQVWLSFYQIYCGKLYDLLNEKNILFAREDSKNNVNIVGLSERKIDNAQNLMSYISYGTSVRVTSQNGTNNDSSRSHAILQVALKKKNKIHGKISFIDLAGSERAADHADQLEKQTRIDGAEINKSLLALKECIRALDQNKNHTPFRGSKLTMVLKDSFTGYCRTVMIGNIAPNSSSSENTLNTLKYADRVKQLKKAKQNFHQLQKMDQMERQLMLPRNNLPQKSKIPQKNENESDQYMENAKGYSNRNNNNAFSNPKGKVPQNMGTSGVTRQNPPLKINQPQTNNYFQKNKMSPPSVKAQRGSHTSFPIKQLPIQQNEPKQIDINQLSQKHDQIIELILQEQQKLIKEHECHINETIQLTKKQMNLRNEADKIGSNIQDYLENLDNILDQKMNSIALLRDRIFLIKGHLRQSKRIEEQYLLMEKHFYQQQNQDSLIDDEELFV